MSATEEQQKAEKEKSVPKDAQVMISILKDMGINEFEPRVVNQMLEFSYRCVSFAGSAKYQILIKFLAGMSPMSWMTPKCILSTRVRRTLTWTT